MTTIETSIGLIFDVFQPSSGAVDIEDIAYSLAGEGRFSNHCRPRYYVAQHSVFVADLLGTPLLGSQPKRVQLAGLLHDAHEAYLRDFPSPLKPLLPGYETLAKMVQDAVDQAFGIDLTEAEHRAIKQADAMALHAEGRQFMPSGMSWWSYRGVMWDAPTIHALDSDGAYVAFMDRFERYGGFQCKSAKCANASAN